MRAPREARSFRAERSHGGNRHGDQWKHVFFPAQMRSHFVREDLEHNEPEDVSEHGQRPAP